jgi:hypothetical protein
VREEDKRLLSTIRIGWHFVAYTQRTRTEGFPPKPALKRLIALGFIEVRTVTISNWLSNPRIESEHRGPYIEARLTDQGQDVREAQSA